ncbi:zinc-binding dehydrogenase, partial [Streptomyces flavofungini]|uniref:zinc-binding dehydrogenase n=1 Tax=Streptomyces flavofungini TaxID=68200 RepID=UPI0034DEF8A4
LTPRGTLVIVGGEGGSGFLGGMSRGLRAVLLSPFIAQNLRNLVSLPRREDLLTLRNLAERNEITPVIDRAYPLAEAPAALRHLRQGHPRGKLVITV